MDGDRPTYYSYFTPAGPITVAANGRAITRIALGKAPLLTANLHLGEGTGAVASLPLWDMALSVYQNCYSFAEGGITPYTPQC